MGKAACFVVTYSAIIIGLFGVMCYLMSTVNPPPLEAARRSENAVKAPNLRNFYLRRMGPHDDTLYGLHKDKSHLDAHGSLPYLHNLSSFPAQPKELDLVKVRPPLWPRTTVKTNIRTRTNTASKKKLPRNQTQSSYILQNFSIKGHRRSINDAKNKTINASPGSLILKVLDGSGEPRIEIRLSPNEMVEPKRSRVHRSSYKNDSQYNLIMEENDEIFTTNELQDTIEIKILPNISIIINTEAKNFTHKFEDILSINDTVQRISADNKTMEIKNITTSTTVKYTEKLFFNSVEPSNSTATEPFGMKVMFDNVTRHLQAQTKL